MLTLLTILLTTTGPTTLYPGFGDRPGIAPRAIERHPRVEAVRDLGPILEMIVRCSDGSTIVTFSKVERLYCRPKGTCNRDLRTTVQNACNGA